VVEWQPNTITRRIEAALAGSREKLTTIYLERNPCAKTPNYSSTLKQIFPNLEQIDSDIIAWNWQIGCANTQSRLVSFPFPFSREGELSFVKEQFRLLIKLRDIMEPVIYWLQLLRAYVLPSQLCPHLEKSVKSMYAWAPTSWIVVVIGDQIMNDWCLDEQRWCRIVSLSQGPVPMFSFAFPVGCSVSFFFFLFWGNRSGVIPYWLYIKQCLQVVRLIAISRN